MLRLMSGTPVVTNVTLCVCVYVCTCGRERESLEWVLCCLDDTSNVSSLLHLTPVVTNVTLCVCVCVFVCVCMCVHVEERERKP